MHFYFLHFPVVYIVWFLGYIFDDYSITLIRGGDVELNPGPNSGETERYIHSLLVRYIVRTRFHFILSFEHS